MIRHDLLFRDNDNVFNFFKFKYYISIHHQLCLFSMRVFIPDLESKWKIYFDPKTHRPHSKDTHWKEEETIMPSLEEKTTTPITESQTSKEKYLEIKLDDNSSGIQNENKDYIRTVLCLTCTGCLKVFDAIHS